MIKNILPVAAAGLLSLFAAVGYAGAGEAGKAQLGPVGPHQPIFTKVGDKRLLAFYEVKDGNCAVNAVMSDESSDAEGARVRFELHPGELFHFDHATNERVVFTCAPGAKAMTVLNKGELLTRSASALY